MLEVRLFDRALMDPPGDGADELLVVSGYASPAMASRHLREVAKQLGEEISVRVIVGMTGREGLPIDTHRGFTQLESEPVDGNFSAAYVTRGYSIHSKVYVWRRGGVPQRAFVGSANYTQNGFGVGSGRHSHHEVLVPVDAREAFDYFVKAEEISIPCTHIEVEDEVVFYRREASRGERYDAVDEEGEADLDNFDHVDLPLVQTTRNPGEVHNAGAGLNWGQPTSGRPSRNRNEAYIPVPSSVVQQGFFPPRGVHFGVSTTDGKNMIMTVAQANDKALETPGNNALLGEYFRYRLGIPDGAFVPTQALVEFGAKTVRFFKTDDEEYWMDFSPRRWHDFP